MHGRVFHFAFCKLLFSIAIIALLTLFPGQVSAEGGCPPGSYPIGGQGVQGCAPIPASGSGVGESRPSGRWIKTWGAISMASNGKVGIAWGLRRKRDAINDAVQRCENQGASDCRVLLSYKNQCAAIATSVIGVQKTGYASSETVGAASVLARQFCSDEGGTECEVVHANCTEPQFEYF
ncbi:DUF4189 domain-containing protein [Stenotrophomonas pictorum]|uniref:DUF4189 domain-containing protein n=1 Tax=Stenotrophomonas pictorum TaxID=86184 RepID=UPI0009F8BBAE|nr:DUF4189 domain-containing protein [Stenotrophomonas pictorum]